jgi:calcium-dependent protein kinase
MGCGKSKKSKPQEPPISRVKEKKDTDRIKVSTEKEKFSKFTLNNYEVTSQIVRVPYATLFNARQTSADLPKTLKIVDLCQPEGISLNPKHLETEIKQLKSLDHINILRVHDMFPYNNKFCIVMEPLENSIMLLDFIQSLQHMKESLVCKIMSQIFSAIQYCHLKKVIHRDLNPKLIYVINPNTCHIKISEFGASAFMDPDNNLVGKSFPKVFTAPEVFTGFYNEKCDLWSAGVILYLLLTGEHPAVPFHPDGLQSKVSHSAFDLLCKLMNEDFKVRISAAEALEHPWIKSAQDDNGADVDKALKMLKKFNKISEAQDAVREFVASQIISYNDSQYFIENFQKLDSNNDGKITREELMEHYTKTMSSTEATEVVKKIFEVADRDKNGSIEFAEFIRGSMKTSSLLSIENIEKAFKLLDKDNNQNLSIEELQYLLGDTADKPIRQLIQEADQNKDGQVSFSEFLKLLKKKYE